MQLPHLASRLYGTPLLVARSKLDILLSVLGSRIDWPEPQVALPSFPGAAPPRAQAETPPGIAVIPIYGTLVRRALALDAASGLTSYGEIGAMLDAALADPAVTGILLDIDSPGGEAGGVFELARRVRAADAVKPVWAIASDGAFSAAYAIACAGSRVYVTETGGVGSIGVIAMHVDQSARDAQQGYRYTAITAGDQKNDLSPHQPLDKDASARLQAEVDRLYGIFIDHVAAMRGLESRFVRSTQAGVYFGSDAVSSGLADAQGSFDETLMDFSSFLSARRSRNAAAHNLTVSAPSQKELTMKLESQDASQPMEAPTLEPADSPAQVPVIPAKPEVPAADEVTEDIVQSAVSAARADAVAIAELCQLAGQTQRTAAFLLEGASESQVRKALLAARAESPEITSVIHPDAANKAASPEHNPLMKAVKKLTGKD
jgi:signal peptide peptidase SppA